MAQNAPPSEEIQDIQFKLHDKFSIYSDGNSVKSSVSLLAVSSPKGLLFAGSANGKELKVFKLRDIVDSKTLSQTLNVRVINLPGEPKVLACSCDGSMLAVNYVLNNTGFLQIYHVDSFLTPTLSTLCNLPVAPESDTFALQLLWNPVIPNNIALILTDGSVAMFTINAGGQYDKVTLGKEQQVKCGCWSPKGKQIVFGFPEGKLQQFKPNLQPARVIICPPGIHATPFDCIAVHWLSTFQFATIFLERGEDVCPSLYIVNAPKAGPPVFINYYDICYSSPGPRVHQLSFNHIPQWNLLLVTSANGVEVGVLGTKETGETPTWTQYTLLGEARIEMPLTESKDETYPLGFAFDNASSHQVTIGENKLPVMPMIHVLSTHGQLVSYNFLNLSPNAVDICSPPPPLNDVSNQFVPLSDKTVTGTTLAAQQVPVKKDDNASELSGENKQQTAGQGFADMTFSLGKNVVTSTPTFKDKPTVMFGSQSATLFSSKPAEFKAPTSFGGLAAPVTSSVNTPANNKPTTGLGFEVAPSNTAPFSQPFGGMTTGNSFGGFSGASFAAKPSEANNPPSSTAQQTSNNINRNAEVNKPLYTVPSTFTPPNVLSKQTSKTEVNPIKPVPVSNRFTLNTGEIDEVVKQMIAIQIEAFETELRQIRQQSQHLMENLGSANEMKSYTKKLHDLHEIVEQANDHEFEQDVQTLRHSMNESYAMLAECRTKLDLYNNPNLTGLSAVSTKDPTSRRQLAKLQAYSASNQYQLSQLNLLIEAQWSQYQDVIRRNSKNQMHIPCLDGIYQRMSKLKDILSRQRTNMNHIKTKLKQKGLNYKTASDNDATSAAVGALTKNQSTMESLADSILSMSLSQVVSQSHAKLSEEKLNAIRNFTSRQQKIAIIKPKRPDRVGLKSEVILETKLETERKQKEIAKKHLQQQQQIQQQQQMQQQQQILQHQLYQQQLQQQLAAHNTPINYQSALSSKQLQQNYPTQLKSKISQNQQQQQQPVLAKPTASKPAIVTSQPPTFITPASSTGATLSFGGNSSFVKTSLSAPKSDETMARPSATSTPFTALSAAPLQEAPTVNINAGSTGNDGKENKPTTAPISFAAKVIGGNDAKQYANLNNKTVMQSNIMQPTTQSFAVAASAGFSAFATTKPTAQNISQEKQDKTKKPEEAPKQFSFNTPAASTPLTVSAANAFARFTASTKQPSATTTLAPSFSTPLFGSCSSPAAVTPFGTSLFSSSTVKTAPNEVTSSVANSTTKAVTNTTSSAQSAAVVTAKPAEAKTTSTVSTTPAVTTTTTTTSSSTVSATATTATTGSSKPSIAPPNVTSALPEAKPAATAAGVPTSNEDPTDFVFRICNSTPKAAENLNKSTNIFSCFAASESGTANSSLSSSTTTAPSSTAFSFVAAAASTPTSPATEAAGKTAIKAPVAITSVSEPTTSSVSATTATVSATVTAAAPTTIATTSSFSFTTTSGTAVSATDSLFGALSVSPSAAASTAMPTTTSANIFGSGSFLFSQTATAASTSTTTSLFGGGAAVASSAPSLFGSTVPAATSVSGSIFASTAAASTQPGSIFAGIPKPEQSIFSAASTNTQTGGGLFAAAAANTKPAVATGGSIFGGGPSTGFGSSAAGSIFGGGAASSNLFSSTGAANTGGSLFSAAAGASNPPEGGSIFSSPTQQSGGSSGSLFNKPCFGATAASQTTGGIFGASNSQSPTPGGFGTSGGSIFSSPSANTAASGVSIFGAAAAATAPAFGAAASPPGFGSFSQPSTAPAFASPTAGAGFGAQASPGFGAPQQQSAFSKPFFGGPAAFGSPQPAFGAQPTFGGAPTFGSPKGFGSFASTSPTPSSFGASNPAAPVAASKGNIFETLGSQESGLSFGNLAHSTQPPQQKLTFGGSSFMNYRS